MEEVINGVNRDRKRKGTGIETWSNQVLMSQEDEK